MLILGINKFGRDKKLVGLLVKVFVVVLAVWIAYKGGRLAIDDVKRFNPVNLLDQQDYGEYETDSFEKDGVTIYYPTEGDRVGYYPFPSAPYDVSGKIEFLGEGIESGIKSIAE